MLFRDDLAVELVLVALLFFEHLVTPTLEVGETAFDAACLAAVEPDRAARQIGKEAAVVADHDQRGTAAFELALQPFDRGQIEMVGRLVEQEDVRHRRQHPGERRAACFAAGEAGGVFAAVEPELFQQLAGLVWAVLGAEPGFDIGERRWRVAKVRLLREIAQRCARLHEHRAAVGGDGAGCDLEQRRFAGAVAADQADPLANGHR